MNLAWLRGSAKNLCYELCRILRGKRLYGITREKTARQIQHIHSDQVARQGLSERVSWSCLGWAFELGPFPGLRFGRLALAW